jgi:SOS-response transcriptional repressor LexA
MTTRPQKWVEEGKRLKLARENARLTQEQVARELDVNRHVVWNWETGRSWPTLGHLRRLTGLYGVTVDWLMGNEDRVAEARPVYSVGQLEELEMASVAIIGAVSAGGLVEAWQEDLGHLEVPRSILREAPRAFGLRVSGNSLASEWIYEGAIVVVDPDATFVDGKIYAVRVEGGEVAARRLFDMDGRFKLVTGDGNVDEYPKDRVTIIGRVRWSFREH